MRLRGTTMGLLAASAILSGCVTLGLRDFSEITRQNNARIMTLQRGMTPEQVIEHIGLSNNFRVPNPVRSEMYPAGDDTFRLLYFFSQLTVSDGKVTDEELMPVVFKNGMLDGWGWSYWEGVAAQYSIRIRP